MAKKPLILADDTPAVERTRQDDYIWEEHDSSYIPGYAEHVKANDIASSRRLTQEEKDKYYQRWNAGPKELPVNFVWLRISNAAGGVSHSAAVDRMVYTQAGYRICRKDDFTELMEKYPGIIWDTPWDRGSASLEADGTIRRLDSALFVVMTDDPRYVAWQRRRAEDKARYDMVAQPSGPEGWTAEEERGNFEADVIER